MKYLYGRPNADGTLEWLQNSFFDLYLFLGKYAQFCSQNKYSRFEEFLADDPDYLRRREWTLFRKGYCFVRDVIMPSRGKAVSGRMLRRMACKYPLEVRRIPTCTPEIMETIFSYVLSSEAISGWHDGLQGSFYFSCNSCLKNTYVENCIVCADRSLGFQMDLLKEKIRNGSIKAQSVKRKIENQFREKDVVGHCDVGGV